MDPPLAAVEVIRKPGATAQLRDFILYVDNEEAGRLSEDSHVRVPIAAGKHVIHLRVDWCESRRLTIQPEADEVIELACRAPDVGLSWLFRPRRYIDLRPSNEPFPPQRPLGRELGLRLGVWLGITVFTIFIILPVLIVAKAPPSVDGWVCASVIGVSALMLAVVRIPVKRGSQETT